MPLRPLRSHALSCSSSPASEGKCAKAASARTIKPARCRIMASTDMTEPAASGAVGAGADAEDAGAGEAEDGEEPAGTGANRAASATILATVVGACGLALPDEPLPLAGELVPLVCPCVCVCPCTCLVLVAIEPRARISSRKRAVTIVHNGCSVSRREALLRCTRSAERGKKPRRRSTSFTSCGGKKVGSQIDEKTWDGEKGT